MPDPGFETHDHAHCIRDGIASVEAACAGENLRLTPVRRRVMELLLEDHRAQGAYDILARLAEDGLGSQPPVAYRALDFLVGHGFAHRIERLNAYIACTHPGTSHSPVFLICRSCHAVAEAGAAPVEARLDDQARALGFSIERTVLEAEGLCPACTTTGAAP